MIVLHDDNGSNVSDFPPSDTAVLSPDNIKVDFARVFLVHEKYLFQDILTTYYQNSLCTIYLPFMLYWYTFAGESSASEVCQISKCS